MFVYVCLCCSSREFHVFLFIVLLCSHTSVIYCLIYILAHFIKLFVCWWFVFGFTYSYTSLCVLYTLAWCSVLVFCFISLCMSVCVVRDFWSKLCVFCVSYNVYVTFVWNFKIFVWFCWLCHAAVWSLFLCILAYLLGPKPGYPYSRPLKQLSTLTLCILCT